MDPSGAMYQVARHVAGTEDQPTKQHEGHLAAGADLFTFVTVRFWRRRLLRSLTTGLRALGLIRAGSETATPASAHRTAWSTGRRECPSKAKKIRH